MSDANTEWEHLKKRDNWDQPEGAGDDDAFLMICCMETWFLADREALAHFFQGCWQKNAIPQWPEMEKVPKKSICDSLNRATKPCGKRAYSKGDSSFKILKKIDPAIVEKKCPRAKRLLERLRTP